MNAPALIDNLSAAGLTAVVIDENTDMDSLPTLNAAPAPANPVQKPLENLALMARTLNRSLSRACGMDTDITNQRTTVLIARNDVTRAMTEGGDFDASSRAFKQANNKLDRMIEAREVLLANAKADIRVLRGLLDELDDEIATLEAQ